MATMREVDLEGDEYVVKFNNDYERESPALRKRPTFRRALTLAPRKASGSTEFPERRSSAGISDSSTAGVVCEGGVCMRTPAAGAQDGNLNTITEGKQADMEQALLGDDKLELQLAQEPPPMKRHYFTCLGYFFDEISLREVCAEFCSSELQNAAFAEFLAQMLFNFCSCGTVAAAQLFTKSEGLVTMQAVLMHIALLIVLIYTFAPLSGAHINPTVSVAFTVTGLQSVPKGLAYILAQCCGGIAGSFLLWLAYPEEYRTHEYMGVNHVPDGRDIWNAFVGEIVASFILLFVIFAVAIDPRGWGKLAPIAVALTVGMLIFIDGPISSMCTNPARALGSAVVSNYWDNHWIFWTAPFIGGIIAGWIYVNLFLFREQAADEGPSTCPRTNARPYVESIQQVRAVASGAPTATDLKFSSWIKGPPPNLLNSVLVLEFFGVECKPCRYTVPHLNSLNKKYTKLTDRIVFIGISEDDEDKVKKFVKELAPEYNVAVDNDGQTSHDYLDMLEVGAIPAAVVVSTAGQIVWHGHPTSSDLEDAIQKELRELGVVLQS